MILIIEPHPIQYRAPLYAEIERIREQTISVLYESLGSVRGYKDKEFGESLKWDIPLLEGYQYHVIEDYPHPIHSIITLLTKRDIQSVYLTGYTKLHLLAYFTALILGKRVLLRVETQDEAYFRTPIKSLLRGILYKVFYAPISEAYYIGKLNKKHLQEHGFNNRKLFWMPYIVYNPIAALKRREKVSKRNHIRNSLAVSQKTKVVGFFGKLIPKKNPLLILQSHLKLSDEEQKKVHYLFVGSGEEEHLLKDFAEKHRIPCTFTGFLNQKDIHDYYLANDIICLPSRQMGETWGLVVNEGLQAGNAALISNHVGSSANFCDLERVAVFKSEDPTAFAEKLTSLLSFQHNFDWCEYEMEHLYSMRNTASSFMKSLRSSDFPTTQKLV